MKKINSRQITICGLLTSVMFIIGLVTNLISIGTGKSIFQVSDFLYIALLDFLNPFISILSAIMAGVLTDLFTGGIIYIPITIIVKFLIGVSFIVLKKFIWSYLNIFISYLWIFTYVLYAYFLFDSSLAIVELLTDTIQYFTNTLLALVLYLYFKKIGIEQKIIKSTSSKVKTATLIYLKKSRLSKIRSIIIRYNKTLGGKNMSRIYHSKLVNSTKMIKDAHAKKYAIGHFNINNLEWTKAILEAAQESKTPVIIATSEGAMKYMGGPNVVVGMVNGLLDSLNITVPVALHLDHGQSIETAKKCIEAGYSSVMFDGSHLPYEENISKVRELMNFANKHEISVEAEIGSIGGEEDGVVGEGELGDPKQAAEMSTTGISMLAAGIGNIHGKYPEWWKSLSFDTLEELQSACNLPMVLHGGSGIPQDQVEKAIKLGISKINVNTELQLAFRDATREYIEAKKDLDDEAKGFDPRKLLAPGFKAIKQTFLDLTKVFGCQGKAK